MDKNLAVRTIDLFSDLCSKRINENCKDDVIKYLTERADISEETSLSKRQFNEILLLCNETRVTDDFFHYFTQEKGEIKICELYGLIETFKVHSMLKYGNFRFAFKKLTRSTNINADLGNLLKKPQDLINSFKNRPKPIIDIKKIARNQVHKLGYLTDNIRDNEIIEMGKYNTKVYLTSDFMDVYVATSMRDEADFQSVFDLCHNVFNIPKISDLNIRYFDPTQSFHDNRIVKGLIEGLMLKRAKCTIYSSQEVDSFGKDSELASTLAQGKPVIAYVPKIDPNNKKYHNELFNLPLRKLYSKAESYRKLASDEDWKVSQDILDKIDNVIGDGLNEDNIKNKLKEDLLILAKIISSSEAKFYDNRAQILRNFHPLGFQVHLETGVAHGVLIARTFDECADLLYRILTNQLEFDILKPGESFDNEVVLKKDEINYLLIEKISKCAYRVVTTDRLLENSFWNFYLN